MTHIALIPVSSKPYHAGHDGLIRIAAGENDIVMLFVSLSDRKRPGEVPILGKDMETVWKTQIEPSLPENVQVTYGGSPVRNVYTVMGDANEAGSDDTFVVYSDPDDLAQNFPENSLEKYAGNLWANDQIILRPVERASTVNVSGTKMRQFLATGDKKSFVANLPKTIDGNFVWNLLAKKPAKKTKTENVLRSYVEVVVKSLKDPRGA